MIDERLEITLAAVDMAKGHDLCKRYDILVHPFLFFKNGKMKFRVNMGHSVEKLLEFCRNGFIELPKAESQVQANLLFQFNPLESRVLTNSGSHSTR